MARAQRRSRQVPVLLEREGSGAKGWGRLLELNALGAEVLTLMGLERGEEVFLDLELGPRKLSQARCRVVRSSRDEDGYFSCGLKFEERETISAMKEWILDWMSR